MIARLQAFYGGDPMSWIKMPLCVLRSYFTMLNRLRAEKALESTVTTMVGTGSMKQSAAERTVADWQRDARGPRPKSIPMTEEERKDMMRATGWFEVEEVPVV